MKKHKKIDVSQNELRAAIILFVAVFLLGVYRLFMGVSVADEALYVALADFPRIGGQWFVDDITIQTTSAILISPFISIYTATLGTDGVVLFSRLLYLISAGITGIAVAIYLQRFCRKPVAIALGSIYVAYVPFGLAVLDYNTMGSQYFALASILTLIGVTENKPRWSFAGAIFWVLCVFSYPTALLTFLLFFLLLGIRHFRQLITQWKPVLIGLIFPSAILVGVLIWCGIDNIINATVLSRNFNMPFSLFKIPFGINLIASYFPPWWMLVGAFAIWIALQVTRPALAFVGLLLYLLAYMMFGEKSESQFGPILWTMIEATIVLVVATQWRKMPVDERSAVVNWIVPAIFGSVVAWMTSRMTVYNMHGTAIFAAFGVVAFTVRRSIVGGWCVALLILGFVLSQQMKGGYEDIAFDKMDYQIGSGPYRFLWTYERKGKLIEAVQEDLKNLPEYGSIQFKDHFPAGFLMSNHTPSGPTINILPAFIHPEARPIYHQFYTDRSNFPDFIFEFRSFPMGGEDWQYLEQDIDNPKADLFRWDPFYNFFMRSGEYSIVADRGVYRILKRTKTN